MRFHPRKLRVMTFLPLKLFVMMGTLPHDLGGRQGIRIINAVTHSHTARKNLSMTLLAVARVQNVVVGATVFRLHGVMNARTRIRGTLRNMPTKLPPVIVLQMAVVEAEASLLGHAIVASRDIFRKPATDSGRRGQSSDVRRPPAQSVPTEGPIL